MNTVDRLIAHFFWQIGKLPTAGVKKISTVLGSLWYLVDRSHRQIASDNLKKAFSNRLSDKDRRTVTISVFRNLISILFEIGWAMRLEPEDVIREIDILGLTHVEKAMAQNRGIIAITAHTGNWELLSMLAAVSPTRINIVYRPLDFAPMDRFIAAFRSRFGADVIPKKGSLKRLIVRLRKNEVVALVMDQRVGHKKGVFIDFFGETAVTTKGPAYLALVTRAPVVPIFMRRSKNSFIIEIGEEIPLLTTGDREKDIMLNTINYNRAIETFIRKYPSQWLWIHRRWRIRRGQPE